MCVEGNKNDFTPNPNAAHYQIFLCSKKLYQKVITFPVTHQNQSCQDRYGMTFQHTIVSFNDNL